MEINRVYVNGQSYDIQDSRITSDMTNAATPSTNGTGGTAGLMSAADKEKLDSIATGATANAGTVTGIAIGSGGTNYTPTNGVVTIPAYPTVTTYYAPTTTGTSGQVWKSNGSGGEWGNIISKYGDITYDVYVPSSNSSGALTLNFNNGPVQVHTVSSANISSVSTSNIPAGHSLHVIFRSDSASATRTVAIAHNATTSCCPEGSALSLTVPEQGSGYTEVDFINVNNIIYVRGV